jgi:hypothetical protein
VADDAIAAAQRPADLSRQQNAAVLNTLAALFAAAGKTSEARQILVVRKVRIQAGPGVDSGTFLEGWSSP